MSQYRIRSIFNRPPLLCAVAVATIACGPKAAPTALPTPSRQVVIPGDGKLLTFENGLTLFVVPDKYTNLVEFDIRHQIGSRDDPQGKGGMAHFIEHLMFQMPVDGPGSTRLMLDVPQHTLFFNAYTAPDFTHYWHNGSPSELETYMKYAALRLSYDCNAVEQNTFLREREVVRNEHRWRGQGLDLVAFDRVNELIFPEGHPYRRPILDGDEGLAAITPADTCEFIKSYYTPSATEIVVTGNVDPLEVLALAKRYLEPLPRVEAKPRVAVAPASFAGGTKEIKAPVKKPTAVVIYKLPKRFTPERAAAEAAIETIAWAVTFFVDQKKDQGSAVESWSFAPLGANEAPLLGIVVESKRPQDLDRALDEVLDAITRGFAPSLKGEENRATYDRARQRARLELLDKIAEITTRSDAYADYLAAPDSGFVGGELANLDNLTSEEAQKIGRKIFARNDALIVKVIPDNAKDEQHTERANFAFTPKDDENLAVPEDIDPAEAHRPLEIVETGTVEGQSMELTLDTGLRVLLVQSSDMPVMDIQLIIGAGANDSKELRDVAELTTRFFHAGDSLEARNIMDFFEKAGGIYDSQVGASSTTFMSRGLSSYLDFIVAGLAEQVVQAEYSTSAIEHWKAYRKDELKKQSVRQAAQRANEFAVAMYGAGHPHVHERTTDPSQLRSLSLRDLEKFRDQYYRAANATLIITGGFDMDLALRYIDAYFGKPQLRDSKSKWLEPKAAATRPPAPQPQPGDVRYITQVDKRKVQTDITIGFPLAKAYGPDHAALDVLAHMLNFRVSKVRQKLGASYGVYAGLNADQPSIMIGGAVDSARAGQASKAIFEAISTLRDDPDFDQQFAFARRTVLRGLINAHADGRLLANQIASAVRGGYSYEYFQDLSVQVANLTPDQVKAQIDKVLQPSRRVTLILGPAEGVKNIVEANGITHTKALPDVVHDEDD